MEQLNKAIAFVKPSLQLVNGKIYCVVKDLFKTCGVMSSFDDICTSLVPNIESEHITVVNSDVLCKLDQKKVESLLNEWTSKVINIRVTGLQHTVSMDWARFSVCVVAKVESPHLEEFLKQWNSVFDTHIKPHPHITIAVLPRTIDLSTRIAQLEKELSQLKFEFLEVRNHLLNLIRK